MKTLIYHSDQTGLDLPLAELGGKGDSLKKMTRLGFKVPPFLILTTSFFKPWLDTINPEDPPGPGRLEWTEEQEAELKKHISFLKGDFFAVRSSSPEEDMENASFAGMYETKLGIKKGNLKKAVQEVFLSAFSPGLAKYKEEQGFKTTWSKIAVVIQEQIKSNVSGVAFTLNPVNNCYDEMIITSNFGLGESVVSGITQPDTFLVDKVKPEIMEKTLGSKDVILQLDQDGKVHEADSDKRDRFSLSDKEVIELTGILNHIEKEYASPLDIEWALKDNTFYLLQARPITGYIPLEEELLTKPGETKRAYLDDGLIEGGTIKPFTHMGLSWFMQLFHMDIPYLSDKNFLTKLLLPVMYLSSGRLYVDLPGMIFLTGGKKAASKLWSTIENSAAEIIKNLDFKEYPISKEIKKTVFAFPVLLFKFRKILFEGYGGIKKAEELSKRFLDSINQLYIDIKKLEADSISVFAVKAMNLIIKPIFSPGMATLMAAEMAKSKIKKIFNKCPEEIQEKAENLDRSLPNNITVEMGLSLFNLVTFLKEEPTVETLSRGIKNKTLPSEFLQGWQEFIDKFGHRGPSELDFGAPCYRETPELLYAQMVGLYNIKDTEFNPLSVYENGVKDRETAYEELLEYLKKKKPFKVKKYKQYYKAIVLLGGFREIHKYLMILAKGLVRKKILKAGEKLLSEGKIKEINQVFCLDFDELEKTQTDPDFDYFHLIEKRESLYKRLDKIKNPPLMIDSRGKILKPPKPECKEGEFIGLPVSPGRVRGTVRILTSPTEKELTFDDILVTRATDPGWTPLFTNVSGILLEVGGVLQHGACVAREYGKPCITGLDNITEMLKDGETIEMDGSTGLVRRIENSVMD